MFLLPTLSPRFYVRPLEGVVRAWTQPAGAMPELFPCHLHRRLDISACVTCRCSATSTSRTSGMQPAVQMPIESQPSWSPRGCWPSCGWPCHDVSKLRGPPGSPKRCCLLRRCWQCPRRVHTVRTRSCYDLASHRYLHSKSATVCTSMPWSDSDLTSKSISCKALGCVCKPMKNRLPLFLAICTVCKQVKKR
jgi:hypothetical protein